MSDSKSERLKDYLRKCASDGTCYIKSRQLASDIPDMSPKQVGTRLRELSKDADEELDIKKWSGGSKAVTWKIRHG